MLIIQALSNKLVDADNCFAFFLHEQTQTHTNLFSSERISNKHYKRLFSYWMDGTKTGNSCELWVKFPSNNLGVLVEKHIEFTDAA